jgi:FKBP-type peptidyl-prolyl cis-trans isomerase FklB
MAPLHDASTQQFLTDNAARPQVTTTASGLQYEVLEAGSGGSRPGPRSMVVTHYHGTLADGTVFDSSVTRGQPAEFGVHQVIPAWTEALQLMTVGAKWRIACPPALAYGERGAGGVIGPNAALVFEIHLLDIKG